MRQRERPTGAAHQQTQRARVGDPRVTAVDQPHGSGRGQRRWWCLAIPAAIVALVVAGPYVTFSFYRVGLRPSVPPHIVFLSLHAVSAGTALLVGPLQFVRRIRAERPRVHRTIGKVYLLAVLVGGLMSLASAVVSESGWSAQVGFVILALFWLYSGLQALRAVLAGRYAEHRVWMIRNYSATFAAVLLRVILIVETALLPRLGVHLEFAAAYDVSVWGSITLSIFVAELFIVQRSIRAVLPSALVGSVPAAAEGLPPHATSTARS